MDDDPADAAADSSSAYFRIVKLELRDPPFILLGADITDTPLLGQSVNGTLIPSGLTEDYDTNGFVDVSMLITLDPWQAAEPVTTLEMNDAHCRQNALGQCEPDPGAVLAASWTVTERADGACLEPIEGSTSRFAGKGTVPSAPCLSTHEGRDLVINMGGIPMSMVGARVGASYDEAAPGRLVNGLLQGFVTLSSANETLLPSYLPLLGGTPLSDYLKSADRDDSSSPNGEEGWWVYMNFVAEQVAYTKP